MRTPLIAGNWKMNKTIDEAVNLVREMLPELTDIEGADLAVCPPYVALGQISSLLKDSPVMLGAQNMYYEEKGAYTGEISPVMLAPICQMVLLGHSERRHIFGESSELINKKVLAALKVELKPVLCVGETLDENKAGKTDAVVTEQLKVGLQGVTDMSKVIVAYEPVWAIGTGLAATGEQANDTIGIIRRRILELYGEQTAETTRILYGGSVTPDNIEELLQQPEIDGGLIGGASLKADQFVAIAKKAAGL